MYSNSKRMRWGVVAPVVAVLTLAGVAGVQGRIDAQRERVFDQELLYLPNEHLLTHFTAGMAPVIASVLWLRTLSYTVAEFHGDGRFTWLAQMGDVVTRLDPHFLNAYRYTAMFLAALRADDDASIELLQRGIPHNPQAWQLPYEIGMVYLTNRRDEPGAATMAAHWLQAATATGTAPNKVWATAEGLMQQHRMADLERAMWIEVLETAEDDFERSIAVRKLEELAIRETVTALNEAVGVFEERMGRAPGSLAELHTAGILPALPETTDPLGGTFRIEADGTVTNTTLLDVRADRLRSQLAARVRDFEREKGRRPVSLDELVTHEFLRRVPEHPYPGQAWQYDPATGLVE